MAIFGVLACNAHQDRLIEAWREEFSIYVLTKFAIAAYVFWPFGDSTSVIDKSENKKKCLIGQWQSCMQPTFCIHVYRIDVTLSKGSNLVLPIEGFRPDSNMTVK